MAETILNCPGCVRQLRIPSEMIGRPVRCPNCATTFTVPQPNEPTGEPDVARQNILALARKAARPAASALMVAALATLIGGLVDTLDFYWNGMVRAEEAVEQHLPHRMELAVFSYRAALGVRAVFLAASLVILVGAVQMYRLQWRPFALLSSFMALLLFCPIFCYPFNLPVGVWCLMVLVRPEVRAAFR